MSVPNNELSAHSPDRYVAIAVEDLIEKVGKEGIHADGKPTKEYLGMLSLYALQRAKNLFEDADFGSSMIKTACEYFDPFNMSDELISYLTKMIKKD